MKANKAVKRLAKIEVLMSDVMEAILSRCARHTRNASRCQGCCHSGEGGGEFASISGTAKNPPWSILSHHQRPRRNPQNANGSSVRPALRKKAPAVAAKRTAAKRPQKAAKAPAPACNGGCRSVKHG